MAKKKVEKPRRDMTRRQLASWQKQKKRHRIILIAGITLIVAVLLVVGVGWYLNDYMPLHQTVIRVNNTGFDMNYYIKMLKFYGGSQPNNLYSLVNLVSDAIERNQLVIDSAKRLEITVTDKEVDEKLKTYNPPLSGDYRDAVEAQLLVEKMRDDYFDKQVPTTAEQRQVMAMFLESQKQANDIRARLLSGEDFGTLAAEFSLDSRSKEAKGDLGWHPRDIISNAWGETVLEERVFVADVGALSQPIRDEEKTKNVGYWLVKVVGRTADPQSAKVHGILLGSLDEAQGVRARLVAGEDFATVAKEVSQDSTTKDKGGDLGELSPGTRNALDKFVFDSGTELNTLSQPIRDEQMTTKGGYWLVKVVAVEQERTIDDTDRTSLVALKVNDWVTSLPLDSQNAVENLLTEEQKSWAAERAVKELSKSKG